MSIIVSRFTLASLALFAGAVLFLLSQAAQAASPQFGIYVASRDGTGFKLVTGSADREMTHPRVSPDLTRVVFTRYNLRGADGRATEQQGYEQTEIVLVNLNGTGLKVLVPAKVGVVNANASWSPDGQSIYWLSTDNAQGVPQVRVIDVRTKAITTMPTPGGLFPSDPHQVASQLVFPAKAIDGTADKLWVMNVDGSGARQLTAPVRANADAGYHGDFDPKLSPDGTRVAFMRIDGGINWQVMTTEIATGRETLLTPAGTIQYLPTWSSDGARIAYGQLDLTTLSNTGVFTMNADGTNRVKVPLPSGRLYSFPSWFPLEGGSTSARLVVSGTLNAAF